MYDFKGKHVLVTGAARGIGFEITRLFKQAGATVTLWDVHAGNLPGAVESLSKINDLPVYSDVVDICKKAEVDAATARAWESQPIDVLINNAGIAMETPFLKISEAEWRNVLDVNLTGFFLVSQAVTTRMVERKAGCVVNMSSKNGLDGEIGYTHYNASKAGIVMLTKTMALELAHLGIRVNAVCPGYIETPMSKEIDSPEFVQAFVERYIPMNRTGNIEEVGNTFLFLASEGAGFITGQTIVVDGGQLCGQKPASDQLI
jgi:3-oxoacyl-[acyl-carrier protein] reductase